MKKNDVVLDATLFLATNNKLVNAGTITRWAHDRGVIIDAGTDWPYPKRDMMVPLLNEMQLLVTQAGMSNAQALQAATQNAARAAGLTDRGLIRPGKRADLIILQEDPLKNLSALFTPQVVIKNGVIMTE